MKNKYRILKRGNYYDIQWRPVGFFSFLIGWEDCATKGTLEEARTFCLIQIEDDRLRTLKYEREVIEEHKP